ncbi:MAG TPA: ATP-binding cassette domain-containing protein [Bacteroidales bacterium]|jgi:molybdate transport system ATP-binding protein|nr:ATP-binding cassette domain-containing protein [Bacteroidales bacterium]HNR43069.1 ATP-binding cassette domain-containing protein [Bacteroidales bacterium]HPM18706.1 ATP-binding cassette domain-containing protein [Bacteroidales bacterium]HQG77532.1 ATP-binding cassette domain-containing protein [Bacteroidales bacterium]
MKSADLVFSFQRAVIMCNGKLLAGDLSFDVHRGESWWVCGANGTGKTTLLEIIAGKQRLAGGEMILPENVTVSEFYSSVAIVRRDFSLYQWFTGSASFYQQRYFSPGVEETPGVLDLIHEKTGFSKEDICSAAHEFGFGSLLDRRIVSLSTGEGRRILLLMLWLSGKKVICIDDPYEGLDPEGKQLVTDTLHSLVKKKAAVLVTGTDTSPPDFVSHVLYLRNQRVGYAGEAELFNLRNADSPQPYKPPGLKRYVPDNFNRAFMTMAEMKNITIRYGSNIVQENFSWRIRRGEKWLLSGPNGSGKTTLMSLIYADNPMAYAYDLVLFDRKRGTGETIWEIKEPIGYFSSELQNFFPRHLTLHESVLTGYSNHLLVRNDLTPEHYRQADGLIEAAGLSALRMVPMYRLSFSQCRLALVCRALVKLPPVVILDEPCQGLDRTAAQTVNCLVDNVCSGELNTLIYVTHRIEFVPGIINKHLRLVKYSQE